MKVIAISAVTAGGKTSAVKALEKRLQRAKTLHFDDYTFEGEVDDFGLWVKNGADYGVWNLKPLEDDINQASESGEYDYLILDYPFAYCHKQISPYIDKAIFIDTPLDVAMARRILRDLSAATGDEIRREVDAYVKYARPAYLQMLRDVLPSSDCVVDGTLTVDAIADEIMKNLG